MDNHLDSPVTTTPAALLITDHAQESGRLCFSATDELFGSEDSENSFCAQLDAAWHDSIALEEIRVTLRRDLADFGYLNAHDAHDMRVALKLVAKRIIQLAQ